MHRNNRSIHAECEADTLLMEVLGFKKPGHQQGVQNVIKAFQKYPGVLIIGVIDRDKRQPSEVRKFITLRKFDAIDLLRHPTQRLHYLITHPNLEDWLYESEAQLNGVDAAQFGFKSKRYFYDFVKTKESLNSHDLRNFFNALKQKSKTLQTLQAWLEELVI